MFVIAFHSLCLPLPEDNTPSPQVGSPKVESDVNDSPRHPPLLGGEEGGEREAGKDAEGEGDGKGESKGEQSEEKEDPSTRSEGVIQFVLKDLSNLESQLSNPVVIRNVPW